MQKDLSGSQLSGWVVSWLGHAGLALSSMQAALAHGSMLERVWGWVEPESVLLAWGSMFQGGLHMG